MLLKFVLIFYNFIIDFVLDVNLIMTEYTSVLIKLMSEWITMIFVTNQSSKIYFSLKTRRRGKLLLWE